MEDAGSTWRMRLLLPILATVCMCGCVDTHRLVVYEFRNPRSVVLYRCDSGSGPSNSMDLAKAQGPRLSAGCANDEGAIATGWTDGVLRLHSASGCQQGQVNCAGIVAIAWAEAGDKLAALQHDAAAYTYTLLIISRDLRLQESYKLEAPKAVLQAPRLCLSWSSGDKSVAVSTDISDGDRIPPWCAIVDLNTRSVRNLPLSNLHFVGPELAVANTHARCGTVWLLAIDGDNFRRVRYLAGAWYSVASHSKTGTVLYRHGHVELFPLTNWQPVSIASTSPRLSVRLRARPLCNSILCLAELPE
jgi:hypothetical protein